MSTKDYYSGNASIAEIHRQQAFALALTHHTEAIELLDKIGAKCDLPEA